MINININKNDRSHILRGSIYAGSINYTPYLLYTLNVLREHKSNQNVKQETSINNYPNKKKYWK